MSVNKPAPTMEQYARFGHAVAVRVGGAPSWGKPAAIVDAIDDIAERTLGTAFSECPDEEVWRSAELPQLGARTLHWDEIDGTAHADDTGAWVRVVRHDEAGDETRDEDIIIEISDVEALEFARMLKRQAREAEELFNEREAMSTPEGVAKITIDRLHNDASAMNADVASIIAYAVNLDRANREGRA